MFKNFNNLNLEFLMMRERVLAIVAGLLIATGSTAWAHGPGGQGNPGFGPGGPGMMNPSTMMGPGMMGSRMMRGPGAMHATGALADRDLTADDVRTMFDRNFAWHGNTRLQVGNVTERDADTIVAEIETVDGSLVQRLEVDRHTGFTRQVN